MITNPPLDLFYIFGLFYQDASGVQQIFGASFDNNKLAQKLNDLNVLRERATSFNTDQTKKQKEIDSHYLYEIHATNDPYAEEVLRKEWHEKSSQYQKHDTNAIYRNLTIKKIPLI